MPNNTSSAVSVQKADTKRWIYLVIGLFFIFVFGSICPTWSTITRVGVQALGIFIGVVFFSCTNFGLIMPSLLGMFAIVLTGYMNSKTLIASAMGSSTVYQLMLIYCICRGIVSSGAGEVIARWLITRKFAQGRPMVFSLMMLLACTFGGAFISGTGTILFITPILRTMRDMLGYDKDSKWFKSMFLGCFTCAALGGPLIPFKGLALVIFQNISVPFENAGLPINYASYILTVLVMEICYCVLYLLMMRYVFRVDMSKLKNFDINAMGNGGSTHLNGEQLVSLLGMLVGISYTIVMLFLPKTFPGYEQISGIGQCIWFSVVVAVLSIIRIKGKPVFDAKKNFRDGIAWDVILAVCVFTLIGGMLSSADSGFQDWLNIILGPLFNNMPFFAFMLIMIGAAVIVTNVFSNTATGLIIGTITVPFIITYANTTGINPSVVGAGLVMGASFAFMTMAASGQCPLFHGEEAIVRDPGFIWKYGTPLMFAGIILFAILATVLAYVF